MRKSLFVCFSAVLLAVYVALPASSPAATRHAHTVDVSTATFPAVGDCC